MDLLKIYALYYKNTLMEFLNKQEMPMLLKLIEQLEEEKKRCRADKSYINENNRSKVIKRYNTIIIMVKRAIKDKR